MAEGISFDVKVDAKQVIEKLNKMKGENARKVMQRTMSDLNTRGPRLIAQFAAETYALPAVKLNPRTKSGKGSVSMAGSSLASIEWIYRGQRIVIGRGGFKLWPASHNMRRRSYKTTTSVLRGQKAVLGVWNRPWSQGGAYRAKSPWFVVNGLAMQRRGRSLDWTARGPSIPQMVLSVRHEGRLKTGLQNLAIQRLEHNIDGILG